MSLVIRGILNSGGHDLLNFYCDVLKRNHKPILGHSLGRQLPLSPLNREYIALKSKIFVKEEGNFKFKELKVLRKRLELSRASKDLIKRVSLVWCKLKLIVNIKKWMRRYASFFFNYIAFDLDNQIIYKEYLEYLGTSKRFNIPERWRKPINWDLFKGKDLTPEVRLLLFHLWNTESEFWIPLSCGVTFDYEPESKLYLCKEPFEVPDDRKIHQLKKRVYEYIKGLGIKELVLPPLLALDKASMAKYNDSGVVKRDYEKPDNYDSGFLYQKFLTKPLTPREVWLPGKATKIVNAYWMSVTGQILAADPKYPSSDVWKTYNSLKDHLKSVSVFDLPGFGLQFPRQYVIIVSRIINDMFPSDHMQDLTDCLEQTMLSTTLTKDGVTFTPPRGTGLGYFEGLKTIAVRAILYNYDRDLLSLYGDQALFKDSTAQQAAETLVSYGFISKRSKVNYFQRKVDWAGYQFTASNFTKSRSYWTDLVGAFFQQEHWERKSALLSLSTTEGVDYESYERILGFLYEMYYGYEFEKAEALSHFDDCGILTSVHPRQGLTKKNVVSRLHSPGIRFEDDVLKESLDVTKVVASTAKQFQKYRLKEYMSSKEIPKYMFDYVNPRLQFNKNKPKEEFQGGSFPRWMDEKSLVLYGSHSGTITAGLSSDMVVKAALTNYLARDPYRSCAEGGYSILTPYRTIRGASEEVLAMAKLLAESYLKDRKSVKRHDLPRDFVDLWDTVTQRYDLNQFLYSLHPPKSIKRKPHSSITTAEWRPTKVAKTTPVEFKSTEGKPSLLSEILLRDISIIKDLPEGRSLDIDEESDDEEVLNLLEELDDDFA
jgi:hypothetical protein